MNTYDTVLLTILTFLLGLCFLLGIIVIILIIRLVASIRQVVIRAEGIVDSVEAAADVLKDAGGKLAIFKVLKNIMGMVNHKK